MVKSNQPLQIRLTEPVIFLKGPSTGLDFRGRPQIIAPDAQPAMLRGLLTLRLSKPTRIRKIEIKLEGKSRTEWPEGIGPRRMDTSEEHVIISEKITFFNAIKSESGPDMPRASSLGPGISTAQIDADDELFGSGQVTPNEGDFGEFGEDRWQRGRNGYAQSRSASAMPGLVDAESGRAGPSRWHRDDRDGSLGFGDLSLRDRGPSPAYTPLPLQDRHRSSLRTPLPTSVLPPIMSAPHSANTSDRGDSTSTERQRAASSSHHISSLVDEPLPEDSQLSSANEMSDAEDPSRPSAPARPSILEHPGHRHGSGGEVRFAPPSTSAEIGTPPAQAPEEGQGEIRRRRAASVRTMNSISSGSTHGEDEAQEAREVERHPVMSDIHTAHPSPNQSALPSPAPSIHGNPSTDYLPRNSMSSASGSGEGRTRSGVASGDASRRSSLLGRELSNTYDPTAPSSSGGAGTTEVRAGQRSRIGSASTIVIDNSVDASARMRPSDSRQNSGRSVSSTSRQPERSVSSNYASRSGSTHETHQSKTLRHSLASALGAVKERMSSRSRSRVGSQAASRAQSRAPSRGGSRAPSIDESAGIRPNDNFISMSRGGSGSGFARVGGSARPSIAEAEERTNRFQGRLHLDDLVPPSPFARDSSTGRSRSTDRTASPARMRAGDRSSSRSRGRNKGMKVLTGALDGKHHDDEGEHLHNWKEFKKGTYNYPISFPIPVDSPPSIHAEFGAVVYRLKATVVRVGALTTNLVEDMEVTMIATPQEDDLEETENVTVERQWEEQMRYQIILHGKAFPIGGMIPISVRLMPLMKCRVHRLTVALEEKTDYFAQGKKVARHETPKKFTMLFVKQPERLERQFPLLPLMPDDPTAAKDSPVAQLAAQAAMNNPAPDAFDPTDEGAVYASLYDPMGPWHLEKNLQIPDCAANIKFTTKHDKTNISISHWMKVTIRVERGDDVAVDAKGKRKQFDIIIETPIKILDCRVDRQINSLPTYTPQHPSSFPAAGMCSVHGNQTKHFAPIASTKIFDPLVVSAPDSENRAESSRGRSAVRDAHNHGRHEEDTLLERNIVYDRLMSGQETETGELPPTYGEALAHGSGTVSRDETVAVEVADERTGRDRSRIDGERARSRDRAQGRDSRSRSRLRMV